MLEQISINKRWIQLKQTIRLFGAVNLSMNHHGEQFSNAPLCCRTWRTHQMNLM
jgi:hypothetical protein